MISNITSPFLNDFIKTLNRNDSFKTKFGCWKGRKFPYKPALLLAILTSIEQPFNTKIFLNDDEIQQSVIRKYYDLLTSNEIVFENLQKCYDKKNWYLGFNRETINSILSNIYSGPANHLQDKTNFFQLEKYDKNNKQNNHVILNLKNISDSDMAEVKDILIYESIKCLKKCCKEFDEYDDIYIKNGSLIQYEKMQMLSGQYIQNPRRFQHMFAKPVKDRDQKCVICCIDNPRLLQACHLKPNHTCDDLEKVNENNGITLCPNHHKLFDCGMFTFNENSTIKISRDCETNDQNLLIKQHEKCFTLMLSRFDFTNNEFLKWHQEKVFK